MDEHPAFGYVATRGPKLNLLRIEEQLSAVHLRLARVYVERLPYYEIIKRYDKPTTLFYIDPPYWDCEKYYGKVIFGREDFGKLAEMLRHIEGRFILSLNDVQEIREIYAGFRIEGAEVDYSCCNGKSIKSSELLIRNFD